ncbi:MAG: hypothetical protein ACRDQZ_20600 [Mycobacteriales bacterium]
MTIALEHDLACDPPASGLVELLPPGFDLWIAPRSVGVMQGMVYAIHLSYA